MALIKEGFLPENLVIYDEELRYLINRQKMPSIRVFQSKFPDFRFVRGIDSEELPELMQQCRDRKVRSDTVKILRRGMNQLKNGDEPKDIIKVLEDNARKANANYRASTTVDVFEDKDIYLDLYRQKRNRKKKDGTVGIPYGFKTMDKFTGGMLPGEYITVVARTGIGKTFLMNDISTNAILNKSKVMYCTKEMTWDQIYSRVLTLLSYKVQKIADAKKKINKKKIIRNSDINLGNISVARLKNQINELESYVSGNLFVPDMKNDFSISAVGNYVEQLKPDLVVFDYFGLTANGDNWMDSASSSHEVKRIAMQYDIPFILGAQFNRSGAQNPSLENIALTGAIEQDSDKVFVLTKRKGGTRMVIDCQKFRGGPDGWNLTVNWNVDNGEIVEIRSDDSGVIGESNDDDDE